MEQFKIPLCYSEAEFTEKRSRFIGRVWHTDTQEAAQARIKQMREQHWDAAHNVYAYIIKSGGIMRYSDDGEPQGTSGMPVLNIFRLSGVFDCCCVVTRYFGGVLLGTGGLVRAYSRAARMALEAAGIGIIGTWERNMISCSYSKFEQVRDEIISFGGHVESTDFGADVVIECLLPKGDAEKFSLRLTELTSGTAELMVTGTELRAIPAADAVD